MSNERPTRENYKPLDQNLWLIFTTAELRNGEKGVKQAYIEEFDRRKHDRMLFTDLIDVINHKEWAHEDLGHHEMSELYQHLWEESISLYIPLFKKEDNINA